MRNAKVVLCVMAVLALCLAVAAAQAPGADAAKAKAKKANPATAQVEETPGLPRVLLIGDEVKYNQAAAKVMAESGVETDDLYAVAAKAKDIQLPKNVHFSGEGYKQLAAVVVAKVEKALAK